MSDPNVSALSSEVDRLIEEEVVPEITPLLFYALAVVEKALASWDTYQKESR